MNMCIFNVYIQCVCIYIYMYIYIYIYIYMYTIYIHTYIHTYIYIYMRMCICIFVLPIRAMITYPVIEPCLNRRQQRHWRPSCSVERMGSIRCSYQEFPDQMIVCLELEFDTRQYGYREGCRCII